MLSFYVLRVLLVMVFQKNYLHYALALSILYSDLLFCQRCTQDKRNDSNHWCLLKFDCWEEICWCKRTYLCIAMYVAVCRRGAKTDIQWMGTVKWRKEPCFCLHGGKGFLVNLSLTSLVLLVLILVHDVTYHRVSYSHASRREVRVCFFWQHFWQCLPVCWVLLVVVIHSWDAQTLWMYFMPWSSPFWLWRNLCLIITSVHSRRSQEESGVTTCLFMLCSQPLEMVLWRNISLLPWKSPLWLFSMGH